MPGSVHASYELVFEILGALCIISATPNRLLWQYSMRRKNPGFVVRIFCRLCSKARFDQQYEAQAIPAAKPAPIGTMPFHGSQPHPPIRFQRAGRSILLVWHGGNQPEQERGD